MPSLPLRSLAFMFESSMQVTITDFGMKRTGKLHGAPRLPAYSEPVLMDP